MSVINYMFNIRTMLDYFHLMYASSINDCLNPEQMPCGAVVDVLKEEYDRAQIVSYNHRLEAKDHTLHCRPKNCECPGEPLCGIMSNFSAPVLECPTTLCSFNKFGALQGEQYQVPVA
jgi:hypothetical protein